MNVCRRATPQGVSKIRNNIVVFVKLFFLALVRIGRFWVGLFLNFHSYYFYDYYDFLKLLLVLLFYFILLLLFFYYYYLFFLVWLFV